MPPTQLVPGIVSLGIKRQGRESDSSPAASAEVKTDGAIVPFPYNPSRREA
jgi:hypothetical protein